MAEGGSAPKKVLQKRTCVAGGPGGVSCSNRQDTHPDISIHMFPREGADSTRRRRWTAFVRRHRHDFVPTKWSNLCSAHFEEECFDVNRQIAREAGIKIRLKKDAVPTIDIGGLEAKEPQLSPPLTPRERRHV